jgi:hypothetical protein
MFDRLRNRPGLVVAGMMAATLSVAVATASATITGTTIRPGQSWSVACSTGSAHWTQMSSSRGAISCVPSAGLASPSTTVDPPTTTVAPTTTSTVPPTTSTTTPPETPSVDSGCQFLTSPSDTPAFCDNFSEGPSQGGREGQLNPALWSVARIVGNLNSTDLMPFPSTPVSACQSGVTSVTPDNDIRVCDANSGHASQILVAMSAQNYGFISMRPRQPFDFANRTGTVTFNVDAHTQGGLSYWPSIFITDQPTAGADDAEQVNGLLPRNGIGLDFWGQCNSGGSETGVGGAYTYNNYVETNITGNATVNNCVTGTAGTLNHFEIQLSTSQVSVWGSDAGGANFREIFSAPISLNFSTGYVFFQTNERAPVKYGDNPPYANYYWSGMGFDGPKVNTGEIGYSVPDALTPDPTHNSAPNVGYGILNNPATMDTCCTGSTPTDISSLSIPNVSLAGVKSAYLTFDVNDTYTQSFTPSTAALQYSLNGGPLQSPNPEPNYAAQDVCTACPGPSGGGGVSYVFPVPVSSLLNGTNTVNFVVPGSNNGYPPILSSLDLLTFQTTGP